MKKIFFTLCIAFGMWLQANAQCGITNMAFKSGESLEYDLYFNWQFIWVKVGAAQINCQLKYKIGRAIMCTRYGIAILVAIVS